MNTWREQARLELEEELVYCKDSKDALEIKVDTYTLRITRLHKQLTCTHEMEVSINGGCFGGSDIEKCKHCAYE